MRKFEIFHTEEKEQEKIFGTIKNDEFKINNPTMKEVSKLEANTIEEPDILEKFKKEKIIQKEKNNLSFNGNSINDSKEGDYFKKSLMHVHRLSMRKIEIGKMRYKLINTNARKERYVELVNIDKERASHLADSIFKRRLKYINVDKPNNNSDFMHFKSSIISGNKSFLGRLHIETNLSRDIINKNDRINLENKKGILKTEENINSFRNKKNGIIFKNSLNSDRISISPRLLTEVNTNSKSYVNIKQNNVNNKKEIIKYNNKGIKEIEIDQNRFERNGKNNTKYKINIGQLHKTNSPSDLNSSNVNLGYNTSREIKRLKIPLNYSNGVNTDRIKKIDNNISGGRGYRRGVIKKIPLDIEMINNVLNTDRFENNTSREKEKRRDAIKNIPLEKEKINIALNTDRMINNISREKGNRIGVIKNIHLGKEKINIALNAREVGNRRDKIKNIPLKIEIIDSTSDTNYGDRGGKEKKVIKRGVITSPNIVNKRNVNNQIKKIVSKNEKQKIAYKHQREKEIKNGKVKPMLIGAKTARIKIDLNIITK